MSVLVIALFLITCFLGSVIQAITGFGFGIFVISLFPYYLPVPSSGVAVSALMSTCSTGYIAARNRRSVNWRQALSPLATYFIVSALMITFLGKQPDALFKKLLGVILMLMSVYFIFFSGKFTIRPTLVNGLIAGALSGVLGGLFGMGGPPVVVYFLAVTKSKEEYLGTIQAYFFITNVYSTAVRAINGMITPNVLLLFAIGLPAVALGVLAGRKLFGRLDAALVKKLVYGFMALSGAAMLF